MYPDKITYDACFIADNDEGGYTIVFPQLPGCISEGNDLQEAMAMALDVLTGHIFDCSTEKMVDNLPPYRKLTQDDLKKACEDMELKEIPEGSFIAPISFKPKEYYYENYLKPVKKTLNIPIWLNEACLEEDINFSQVLKEALIKKLDEIYKSGNRKIDSEC